MRRRARTSQVLLRVRMRPNADQKGHIIHDGRSSQEREGRGSIAMLPQRLGLLERAQSIQVAKSLKTWMVRMEMACRVEVARLDPYAFPLESVN
jgi:ABC-type Mn2+/Zn2+ transport system ATPase subunit